MDHRAGLDEMEKWRFLTLLGRELQPVGRSARSQSLYRPSYPASYQVQYELHLSMDICNNFEVILWEFVEVILLHWCVGIYEYKKITLLLVMYSSWTSVYIHTMDITVILPCTIRLHNLKHLLQRHCWIVDQFLHWTLANCALCSVSQVLRVLFNIKLTHCILIPRFYKWYTA
jgi:hypothetical protein